MINGIVGSGLEHLPVGHDYNWRRPHSSLGMRAPAVFAAEWATSGRALGLVTYYRAPKPGKPDYYCLSEQGMVKLADPLAAARLARISGRSVSSRPR